MAEGSNGSDVFKRFGTYVALLGVILASGRIIWGGGGAEASLEQKVQVLMEQQHRDEQEFARKDVLDQRLADIERSYQRLEKQLETQTNTLEEIRLGLQRRR